MPVDSLTASVPGKCLYAVLHLACMHLQWFTFPLLTVVFQFGDIKGLVDNRTVSGPQHTAFGGNQEFDGQQCQAS